MPTVSPALAVAAGRVLRARSGFYTIQTDAGLVECRLRGRVTRDRLNADPCVIGDVVAIRRLPDWRVIADRSGGLVAVRRA